MRLRLKGLTAVPHVDLVNSGRMARTTITGVSTDSRTTAADDLFVALRGDRFDGHGFVADAFARGAIAAVVDRDFRPETVPDRVLLIVDDTVAALGALARLHRMQFRIPVIAVAGSNGKTTTKEMIADVLRQRYRVLKTEGNLNNHIGVPQTLFRLGSRHDIAVVEIGTNHPGELAALCDMLRPTHGLITGIGNEHLEFFGSVEGVAQEEGALFRSLKATPSAVAFVNADDRRVVPFARGIRRAVRYGFGARRVDVRGAITGHDRAGAVTMTCRGKRLSVRDIALQVPGDHNAVNALAAATVGLTFRVPPTLIRDALVSFRPAGKRMEVLEIGGILVYNDTYNANPESTIAGVRTLAAARVPGKRIAVLGDMLELGATAPAEHARVGKAVGEHRLDYLLTFGPLSRHTHDAAGITNAFHYNEKNMLAEFLTELAGPGDAVLVKGSRGMRMEDVVTFLRERQKHPGAVPA